LRRAQLGFASGLRDVRELEGIARDAIVEAGLTCDYASLVDPDRLTRLGAAAPERALLASAAFASDVRLIDNVVLGEDPLVEVA
jgi:pantothenate synthetase